MPIIKAGCVLLSRDNSRIGLIYRPGRWDYSFPKGHIDEGETLKTCAIRETEVESRIIPEIILIEEIGVIRYDNDYEKDIELHLFLAYENGTSSWNIEDEEIAEFIWVDKNEVYDTLSYSYLRDFWAKIKDRLC